jgi:transposase
MLSPQVQYTPPTELDRKFFAALVPADHYLRRVVRVIDFERFRPAMAVCYSRTTGRPALEPVLMLKLEFLQYHDRLSDEGVIAEARVNVAYREFLGLGMESELPDSSSLSVFRGRLGVETHGQIFHQLLAQAREHGLVKDRLRLKDATHVIADVAIPSTIRLVAAMRERLLNALVPYDTEWVEGQRVRAEMIRLADAGATAEQRLEARVVHLREMAIWTEALIERLRDEAVGNDAAWARLEQVLALVDKVLHDRGDPQGGDHLVSLEDPDARFGRHQGSYCGYLLDIAMDEASELVTAINVLPANGDEAADAAPLIQQEEEAHGNDVEAISADAALFQGEKLRELTDPKGLNLEVFVPPKAPKKTALFKVEDFQLEADGRTVTCPAGQRSSTCNRTPQDRGWMYRFRRSTCAACPLQGKCLNKLPRLVGRTVTINDYTAEYAAARQKAQTPEFAAVRRVHRKVERKLAEIVRWHSGRRARSRGQPQVLLQQLMTGIVVNVKRMVHMLDPEPMLAAE